jgi:hypothetical protein
MSKHNFVRAIIKLHFGSGNMNIHNHQRNRLITSTNQRKERVFDNMHRRERSLSGYSNKPKEDEPASPIPAGSLPVGSGVFESFMATLTPRPGPYTETPPEPKDYRGPLDSRTPSPCPPLPASEPEEAQEPLPDMTCKISDDPNRVIKIHIELPFPKPVVNPVASKVHLWVSEADDCYSDPGDKILSPEFSGFVDKIPPAHKDVRRMVVWLCVNQQDQTIPSPDVLTDINTCFKYLLAFVEMGFEIALAVHSNMNCKDNKSASDNADAMIRGIFYLLVAEKGWETKVSDNKDQRYPARHDAEVIKFVRSQGTKSSG